MGSIFLKVVMDCALLDITLKTVLFEKAFASVFGMFSLERPISYYFCFCLVYLTPISLSKFYIFSVSTVSHEISSIGWLPTHTFSSKLGWFLSLRDIYCMSQLLFHIPLNLLQTQFFKNGRNGFQHFEVEDAPRF